MTQFPTFAKTKSFLLSRGVMGGAVATLASLVALFFGVEIPASDQAEIVNQGQGLIQGISNAIAAIAGILAVIGRIRASTRIGLRSDDA